MYMALHHSFRNALPSFLESTVFWLYLGFGSATVQAILQTPLLPSSKWDQTLQRFVVSFIVDYVWRRFLSVGNCIDSGILIIKYAQGMNIQIGEMLSILVSCMASGVVTFAINEVVANIEYASWNRSQGLTFCFLFELCCDFVHQTRNANYFLTEASFLRLAAIEKNKVVSNNNTTNNNNNCSKGLTAFKNGKQSSSMKGKSQLDDNNVLPDSVNTNTDSLEIKARGIQATASFITASIVAFGAYFTHGGPMLNISYTVMAAFAHRDLLLFFVLGCANLLAPYLAGKYVQYHVVEKQRPQQEEEEEAIETKESKKIR